jgi:hypothetical protein
VEVTPIRDYDGLIAVLRARADEIGLAYNLIDDLTGLPNGYTGKLFGPSRVKMIGMESLWPIAEVLAVELMLAPSLELAQKMAPRWERRDEIRRRPGVIRRRISPEIIAKVAAETGRQGGLKRKTFRISMARRSKINSRNAKRGWRKRKNGSPPSVKSGSSGAYAIPAKAVRRAPSASQCPPA